MIANVALLRELFGRLEAHWRRQGAPIADNLAPGLSADEMDELTSRVGLRLPIEAKEWWGWHNGVADLSKPWSAMQVGANVMLFWPLQHEVESCLMQRRTARVSATPQLPEEYLWSPTWFPWSTPPHAESTALECAVPEGEETVVRRVLWDDPLSRDLSLGSLTDVVGWWVKAFDEDVWSYDPDTDSFVSEVPSLTELGAPRLL